MRTKIILHGKISKIYGKEFYFSNITKPSSAISAMESRFPGFKKYIVNESREGAHYEIIVNDETQTAYSLNDTKHAKIIEIAPSILGKDPFTLFFVLGGGLVAAGVYFGIGTLVGGLLFGIGLGLIIAGIAYLNTPIPESEPDEQYVNTSIKNASFLFENPQNVSTQGRPCPISYGRLRIGSYVVGTTLSNYNLSEDRQNVSYENIKSEALVKIHNAFSSSISNYIRGY